MKAKNYHTLGQEASSNPWNLFYIRCENLKQSIKLTILIMVKSNWMFITERVIWGQNPNFQSRNWYEWQKIDTLWVKNPAQIQETYSCKKQKTETVCQIKHSQMSKCLPLEGYFWAKIQMFMPRNWIGIFQGSIYMPSSRTKLTISIEKKTVRLNRVQIWSIWPTGQGFCYPQKHVLWIWAGFNPSSVVVFAFHINFYKWRWGFWPKITISGELPHLDLTTIKNGQF